MDVALGLKPDVAVGASLARFGFDTFVSRSVARKTGGLHGSAA